MPRYQHHPTHQTKKDSVMSKENNVLDITASPVFMNRACFKEMGAIYLRERELFLQIQLEATAPASVPKIPHRVWLARVSALVASQKAEVTQMKERLSYWNARRSFISPENNTDLDRLNNNVANMDAMLDMLQAKFAEAIAAHTPPEQPVISPADSIRMRLLESVIGVSIGALILYGINKLVK